MSRIDKSVETESRLVVVSGWREKGIGKYGVSFWDDGMFWNDMVVIVAQHYEYTKSHWIVHFKMV